MCAAALFLSSSERSEAIAAVCLIVCFASLAMAVVGGFGFLREHSATNARPPKSALILGAIGVIGGMVTAMASVLIADLAASAK
jgi:multisubunit Na+/H+ antiporter MnhC subunit